MFTYYYSPVLNKVIRFSKDVAQYLSVRGRLGISEWTEINVTNSHFIKLK